MLRTVGRGRHPLLACRPSVRLYSLPTNEPFRAPPPPPSPASKPPTDKPKVIDLRPGPIKPPPKRLNAAKPAPAAPPATAHSLGTAKEEVIQDIHSAEVHGILIPPPADANWFKRTLHQAIQLLKFYYRGVKLIFIRRNEIAAIKARINDGGAPLTRAEFRLFQTQKDDINKVIPFLIIALLLEEVIPLIAIYAPFLLPSTCILPSQRQRIEAKRVEKALSYASDAEHRRTFQWIADAAQSPSGQTNLDVLRSAGVSTAVCGILGLSTLGFSQLRQRRIRRHLEFITLDDQLLLHESNSISSSTKPPPSPLSDHELKEFLAERGMPMQNTTDRALLETSKRRWLAAVTYKDYSAQIDDKALGRRLFLIAKGALDLK